MHLPVYKKLTCTCTCTYTDDMTVESEEERQFSYRVVAEELANRIERGEYHTGDKLASELYLAEEFGVARGTMRKALDVLKRHKLIETKSGVGSFVSFHGHSMENVASWTDAIARTASVSNTEILAIDKLDASSDIRNTYGIDSGIYRIVRKRMSGSEPISVEISVLPCNDMLDAIMERGLLRASIALTMKAAGMLAYSGVQDATVGPVPQQYRDQLHASETDRYLIVKRSSFDDEGNIVEYVTSYLNPLHFSLHMTFGRKEEQ